MAAAVVFTAWGKCTSLGRCSKLDSNPGYVGIIGAISENLMRRSVGSSKSKSLENNLSTYWVGSCFYTKNKILTKTVGWFWSTKVDCSPSFPNIPSKTLCFEIMTLETLQNSCVWLCWSTQPLMILTLLLPRLINRELTLIHSSNCFSLYPRVYQLPLCHYVTAMSERHTPF